MRNEWTEYKGYRYLVSSVAIPPGQLRKWNYEIEGRHRRRGRAIVWRGKAPSAAQAEGAARKWINEHAVLKSR